MAPTSPHRTGRRYKQVVENNPNVFLVLAGHERGVGTNLKAKVGVTVAHDVVEPLADYQFYTVPAGELWPKLVDAQGNVDVNGDGKADHKSTDRLQFGAVGLAAGTHTLIASYSGSDTLNPATASVTVTVNLPPVWNAATAYKAGVRVSLNGKVYLAAWASKNQKPAEPYGAWEELAMTEDGTTVWTASRVFNTGDVVRLDDKTFGARWYTRNQAPGAAGGPWKLIS